MSSTDPITTLLHLIQQMTARSIESASAADLASGSFRILHQVVPFDIGVAAFVEHNVDVHITCRPGVVTSERVMARVQSLLHTALPGTRRSADVLVRSEHATLPAGPQAPAGKSVQTSAILKLNNQPAGIVLVDRAEEFSTEEARIVEIFAAQLSVLLDNLEARSRITGLLETDDLTGVPNRRQFKKQLAAEIDRAHAYNMPLSIMIIDLDEFKDINERFGTVTGDVLLSELCGAIRDSVRPADAVSRYGDDEFTVTLPHTDAQGAAAVADRILSRVREMQMRLDGERSVRCTVSIGIAQMDGGETSVRELIQRADDRLFEAKRRGKDRCIF